MKANDFANALIFALHYQSGLDRAQAAVASIEDFYLSLEFEIQLSTPECKGFSDIWDYCAQINIVVFCDNGNVEDIKLQAGWSKKRMISEIQNVLAAADYIAISTQETTS